MKEAIHRFIVEVLHHNYTDFVLHILRLTHT